MSQPLSREKLIELFAPLVDEGRCLTEPDDLTRYGVDWTRIWEPAPSLVLLPKTTRQVAAIVRTANLHKVAIVPSGGRTGLSAGAVAARGEIVVAMDAMNRFLDFNPVDRTVVVEAGVVTQQLQEFAAEKGLFYPVDFASSGSSQIGGNISTNAGGIKVIRYGLTRDWVAGLKVVTGKGEVLDLNKGLVKNATGYDFRHLFIGAEGTLGLVVEATMQLARPPENLTVMVLGAADFAAIMKILETFQNRLDLTAFEFFSRNAMEFVLQHGVNKPFETPAPFYALLEFESVTEAIGEAALSLFESCVEQGWVLDGVMSQSQVQAENLWQLRERISESIAPRLPYKNDISVRVSRVPDFIAEVDAVVARHYPDFEIVWFGHIGDGNVHLNILKPEAMDKQAFFDTCHQVSKWVFEIVENYDGSISAEHGVGMTKKPYLNYTRSDAEIALMKSVKKLFDPNNIMNPGKLIDL